MDPDIIIFEPELSLTQIKPEMKKFTLLLMLVGFLNQTFFAQNSSVSLTIGSLKCEYANSPGNIDNPNPRFSWVILSSERGVEQSAYQIIVYDGDSRSGIVWDSGQNKSSSSNQITYAGKKLKSNSKYSWEVRIWDQNGKKHESEAVSFWTALLSNSEWEAKWIGAGPTNEPRSPKGFFMGVNEQHDLSDTVVHDGRSVLLRNEFSCTQKIKNARVFVVGLGYYELYLNGEKVGDHVLSPAKTNYRSDVLYDTYDVTKELNKGNNAIGIHLGNGWFNPYKKWWKEYRMQWFGAKRAFLQLEIEYEDGEKATIISDENWKFHHGPVLYNCVYDGELYDASKEIPNWASSPFDDARWKPVNIVEPPGGKLRSHVMQPIRVNEVFEPIAMHTPKPNVRVYDMGQNFTGWAKIKVKGKKGTKLRLQFAEEIYEDGSINTTSNEHAKAEATYILKGNGSEIYEPRFTFYGYRYVEVTADPTLPEIESIEGLVVYSDNELTGTFECGNETINKIHRATVWSTKSNMIGYPMDCPQRDERLGWFGDVQVTIEEAMFNFDMPLFYSNWLTGIRKNQEPKTGDIPIISPRPYIWDVGVEWSSTYNILVWNQYLYYGDKRILEENYDAMKRYLSFLETTATNNIIPKGWIGDWGSLVEGWIEGEPESVPTAFYFWNSKILSRVAKVIGMDEDIEFFLEKAESIKETYNASFFNLEKKEYNDGSQMANAFPLFLGLVPEEHISDVLDNLVEDIVKTNGGHLTTGVLGSKYMIDALTMLGRPDVAYLLATQTGYPSWSDMVEKYTTMSEFWTLKQSHNHVMTGSIDAFFYKTLAGINLNEDFPGCERVIIKPYIPESLSYVKASVETIRGKLSVHWENKLTELKINIGIPANVIADVYIPAKDVSNIFEGKNIAGDSKGVTFIGFHENLAHYLVKSGNYEFVSKN